MAEKAPWEEYQEAGDRAPWEEYAEKGKKPKAPPAEIKTKPKREVGFVETAGRTIGEAARAVVGHVDMAAAGLASVFSRDEADRVLKMREGRQQRMSEAYAPKADEEMNTAGSLVGGVISSPIEIAGGFGTQHGSERAAEVMDRGGSLADASVAGGVTAGTRAAMNAVPIKVGGAVGRAIESKVGGAIGGAATGAATAAATGTAGRVAENLALPQGKQFEDLEQNPLPNAQEIGMGAALGAVPGMAAAGSAAVRAGGEAARKAAARTRELAGTAVDANIPVAPHQVSGNKFLKYLGETLEHIPFSGGAKNREARANNYSAGLAKAIDPESTAVVLDDEAFKALQDKAGGRIGEIAARTDVPAKAFGDLNETARRDTPDVQQVIKTYADDIKTIADQNGGKVPGTVLRKLRTEVQAQQRAARGSKGDLANALDRLTHRLDDALSEHAPEGDMPQLLEARRQYAISKAVEPMVAKHPDGNFPPQALMGIVTKKSQGGQTRMARGEGGELGAYAEMGTKLLKDQSSTGTAERNLIYRFATDAAAASKAGALYIPAAIYNHFGPKVVKRMVEADRKRKAGERARLQAEADAAEQARLNPSLAQGFEDVPQGRPAPPAGPLGDLTPDFETAPGAAPPAGRVEVVPTEGMIPSPDELPPPARVLPGGYDPRTGALPAAQRGAGAEIPAVPGRPDLPDAMVMEPAGVNPAAREAQNTGPVGPAGQVLADQATIDAAGTPNAQLARRGQVTDANAAQAARERAEPVPAGQASEVPVQEAQPPLTMEEAFNRQFAQGEEVTAAGKEPDVDPRLAEIERVRASNPSKQVLEVLGEAEAEVKKAIKVEKRNQERMNTAAELRQAADQMGDPKMADLLRQRAERIERPALTAFNALATKHKIPPKAVQAALENARQMEPANVGAFLQRFVGALERRGALEKPIPPKELEALDDQKIPAGEAKEIHGASPEEQIPAGESKELFVDTGRPDKAAKKPEPEKKPAEAKPEPKTEKKPDDGKYPTITSQAEYDALPKDAIYRRGAKLYRKR